MRPYTEGVISFGWRGSINMVYPTKRRINTFLRVNHVAIDMIILRLFSLLQKKIFNTLFSPFIFTSFIKLSTPEISFYIVLLNVYSFNVDTYTSKVLKKEKRFYIILTFFLTMLLLRNRLAVFSFRYF